MSDTATTADISAAGLDWAPRSRLPSMSEAGNDPAGHDDNSGSGSDSSRSRPPKREANAVETVPDDATDGTVSPLSADEPLTLPPDPRGGLAAAVRAQLADGWSAPVPGSRERTLSDCVDDASPARSRVGSAGLPPASRARADGASRTVSTGSGGGRPVPGSLGSPRRNRSARDGGASGLRTASSSPFARRSGRSGHGGTDGSSRPPSSLKPARRDFSPPRGTLSDVQGDTGPGAGTGAHASTRPRHRNAQRGPQVYVDRTNLELNMKLPHP